MFRGLFRGFQKSNAFNSGFYVSRQYLPNISRNMTRNYSSFQFDDNMRKLGYAFAIFGGMCANAVIVNKGFIEPRKFYSYAKQKNWFNGDENENVEHIVNISYPRDIDTNDVITWGMLSCLTSVVFLASPLAGFTLIAYKYILALQTARCVELQILSNIRRQRILILESNIKDQKNNLENKN